MEGPLKHLENKWFFKKKGNKNRILTEGISEKIEQKKKILKGPKTDTPQIAIEGFIKTNNLL